jgi:hypothetical protein
MHSRRTLLLLGPALLGLPMAIRAADTPGWPLRLVRLILPDAPGSGNDTTARLLAPLLQGVLGQPIVVENRGGAGGRIGVEAAFNAPPDGYSFLLGNAGSNGINAAIYPDLPYDLTSALAGDTAGGRPQCLGGEHATDAGAGCRRADYRAAGPTGPIRLRIRRCGQFRPYVDGAVQGRCRPQCDTCAVSRHACHGAVGDLR